MEGIPAQKILVDRYLNWDLVKSRLAKYKNIGSQFPEDILVKASDKKPYYCHYMAWRLGTWQDEELFAYLDQLLENGISLKNWSSKKSQIHQNSFDEFWGLVWELQMAFDFHQKVGLKVEWNGQGPDMKVITADGPMYVECYTYRKSFPLIGFIEELFGQIDRNLKVRHAFFLHVSIPNTDAKKDRFLDAIFQRFITDDYLQDKLTASKNQYPGPIQIVGYPDQKNVVLYVEGDDTNTYSPGMEIASNTGDPVNYLQNAINEALNNKRGSNSIGDFRPNLLAINYLLSPDYQVARILQKNAPPVVDLGNEYDAVMLVACGIDGRVPAQILDINIKKEIVHPFSNLIKFFLFQ